MRTTKDSQEALLTQAQQMIIDFKHEASMVSNQDLYNFIRSFFLRQDVKDTLNLVRFLVIDDNRRTEKSIKKLRSNYNTLFDLNNLNDILIRFEGPALYNLELFAYSIALNYEHATDYLFSRLVQFNDAR